MRLASFVTVIEGLLNETDAKTGFIVTTHNDDVRTIGWERNKRKTNDE